MSYQEVEVQSGETLMVGGFVVTVVDVGNGEVTVKLVADDGVSLDAKLLPERPR